MSQYDETGYKTFTPGAALAQWTRVKISSGKIVAAGITDENDIGVVTRQTFADGGPPVAVKLRNSGGSHKAIAAAAITAGAILFTAASGKVSVSASTAFKRGIALEAAGADGDIIEVMPLYGEVAVT